MKKKKSILILCFVFSTNICAAKLQGQARIDSLLVVLKNSKEDTNKVSLLNSIAFTFGSIDPNSGIKYGTQALNLAEKLEYKQGIAEAKDILGTNYEYKSDYTKALDYYFQALKIREKISDKKAEAGTLNNIGNVYLEQEDFTKAIEFYERALSINEAIGNKLWQANNLINIGNIYALKNFQKGVTYYLKAKTITEELGNKSGNALILANLGSIYSETAMYDDALKNTSEALSMYQEMGDINGIGLSESILGIAYYKIASDSNKTYLNSQFAGNQKAVLLKSKEHLLKAIEIDRELEALVELSEDSKYLSETYFLLGDLKSALESYKTYSLFNDSVFTMEKDKKLTETAMNYEFEKKQAILKAEQEKKDIQQRNIRNSITAGLAGSLVFLIVVYRQRNKIKAGKKRSDELLLNILPSEVAEELKQKGSTDAKQFDEVTVMFTDFKGFTQISEKLSPSELVAEIDTCFKAFDRIIEKYNIEKIKTIGDSYMCAGGLPKENKTHPIDVVNAALEIQDFMQKHSNERLSKGKDVFEIRIGIHTGNVVAGIVGVKKFAYDIWGDTVNIASRMESSGEARKINISETTYTFVKDKFHCIHRGKIQAKNKGEIEMYFVEGTI